MVSLIYILTFTLRLLDYQNDSCYIDLYVYKASQCLVIFLPIIRYKPCFHVCWLKKRLGCVCVFFSICEHVLKLMKLDEIQDDIKVLLYLNLFVFNFVVYGIMESSYIVLFF